MQDGNEGSRIIPDNEVPSQPPSSYVYPVKSLLTGIQPAPPAQSRSSIPCRNSTQAGDMVALQDLLVQQLAATRRKSTAEPERVSSHPTPPRSHSVLYPFPSRTAVAGPSDMFEEHPRTASDPFSPRVQPIDGQSSLPISFTDASLPPASAQPSVSDSPSPTTPSDPPSDTSPPPPHSPGDKALTSFEPKSLSDFMAERLMNENGRASPAHSIDSHASHISQSGIVHLPPSSASSSSRAGSRGSGSHTRSSSRKYYPSSNSNASSQKIHQVPEAQEEDRPSDNSSRSSPDPKYVQSNMQSESEAAGDFLTTRYRHETDENGNHIVVGREGDIRKCEDEVRIS